MTRPLNRRALSTRPRRARRPGPTIMVLQFPQPRKTRRFSRPVPTRKAPDMPPSKPVAATRRQAFILGTAFGVALTILFAAIAVDAELADGRFELDGRTFVEQVTR